MTKWPATSPSHFAEPACGAYFQPYGPVELMGTISAATSFALDALLNKVEFATHRVWAGPGTLLLEQGGGWNDAWIATHPNRTEGAFQENSVWQQDPDCGACGHDQRMSLSISADPGQELVIERQVMGTFEEHQQLRPRIPEAGGGLIRHVRRQQEIKVTLATGPRPTDIRARHSYKPDRRAEQAEIDYAHKKGLVFLGDWHTHPESLPSPSAGKTSYIQEAFKKCNASSEWVSSRDRRNPAVAIQSLCRDPQRRRDHSPFSARIHSLKAQVSMMERSHAKTA